MPPTTRPSVPIINTTKRFPETRERSQPKAAPATIPVTVNFKMFFATASLRLLQMSVMGMFRQQFD